MRIHLITYLCYACLFCRTYPKKYQGVGAIERYSQSPITNGNGTIKCVVSKTALTHDFLLHEDVSNGLELSAFIDRDIDRNCEANEVSPPKVLVRVSSLTATTTHYVDTSEARTSAASKASPSFPLSPPTVTQTTSFSSLSSRSTILANPSARDTASFLSIDTKSMPTRPTPLHQTDSASAAAAPPASHTPIGTENSDVGLLIRSSLPAPVKSLESSHELTASQPTTSTSSALGSQIFTSSQHLQPLVIAGLTFIPSKPEPSQEQKGPMPSVADITTVSALNPSSAPVKSGPGPVVVGGFTIDSYPSIYSIAATTLTQRGPGVTISGTRISIEPSNVVMGPQTFQLPPSLPTDYAHKTSPNLIGFSVAGTFITAGAMVTVSGTPVSLGLSNIVVGTRMTPLPSNLLPSAELIVGGQPLIAAPTGFPIDGISLLSNGLAVTIPGTPVSLDASGIVIGTRIVTEPFASSPPIITVAGETFLANPTGFLVGNVTVSPNGAPVTISGTPISLGSSAIVIGTSTLSLPAEHSVLTVDSQKLTVNPSGFFVGGTELHRGGSPITVSGTPISLGDSDIIVGSSTVSIASVTNGLGPAILSGLGFTTIPTTTAGAAAGNGSEQFTGVQVKMDASMRLLVLCVGLVAFIWA